MGYSIDTHPKSGTNSKIGSDSRVVAFESGRNSPKYWQKRTCLRCKEANSPYGGFDRVATNYRTDISVYHDYCKKCRAQLRAEWEEDPLYSQELEDFWRRYMPSIRAGAYSRSIVMAVDAEDLIGLYLRQRGCCALSGLELDFRKKGKVGRANTAHLRPSVDRIDSRANYTIGNIQIVAQAINLMKGALPQSSFVEICGAIARHNLSL